VTPKDFFNRKYQQKSYNAGDPLIRMAMVSFDVLIKDFKHETLKTTITEQLGVSYLSKATETETNRVV